MAIELNAFPAAGQILQLGKSQGDEIAAHALTAAGAGILAWSDTMVNDVGVADKQIYQLVRSKILFQEK